MTFEYPHQLYPRGKATLVGEDEMFLKKFLAVAGFVAMTAPASAASVDLAFIVDRSSSITNDDYAGAMDALAQAIANNVTFGGDDVFTISVVGFATGAQNIVERTTITSQADLDGVVAAIAAEDVTFGSTNYAAAFDLLLANFTDDNDSSLLGDRSIINMMTDGNPNRPSSTIIGQQAAYSSAIDLQNAGWDSLSFEGVGTAINTNFLARLGFGPGGQVPNDNDLLPIYDDIADVTDPFASPFVLELATFGDYESIIGEKLRKSVGTGSDDGNGDDDGGVDVVPLPAAVPLLLTAFGVLGLFGRRRA